MIVLWAVLIAVGWMLMLYSAILLPEERRVWMNASAVAFLLSAVAILAAAWWK